MERVQPPLYVDLDGSLVECDTLRVSISALLRATPYIVPIIAWAAVSALLRGRARFKRWVSRRHEIDVKNLPYREELVCFLRQERDQGRSIVLATGADSSIAEKVAAHLGLFDRVIASDGYLNQTGATKLSSIQKSSPVFDYIGDSFADLPIFCEARKFYLAGQNRSLLAVLPEGKMPERIFG